MAGEKYKMFKQFMHNELGITKEDIREWVKESVREEAAKMIAKTYEDFDVKREIRDLINSPYNSIRKDLLNACAAEIIKDFKLVYKPSSENQSIPLSELILSMPYPSRTARSRLTSCWTRQWTARVLNHQSPRLA